MAYTYKDIAKKAKVSISTVSRVINGKDLQKVGKKTQERVSRVVADLDFTPNVIARSLVSRKTFNIAVVVKDFEDIYYSYFSHVVSGIAGVLEKNGYYFQLTRAIKPKEEPLSPYYMKAFEEKRVDGMCILVEEALEKDVATLFEKKFPVVLVNRYIKGIKIPKVLIDNKEGLFRATKELLDTGHKRIAFLSGALRFQLDQDRLAGYKKALSEAGAGFDENLVAEGLFIYEKAYEATGALLKQEPRITGIVASDDVMALAAIRRIRDAGLSVPEHISVIGFNDMFPFPPGSPTLSSMRLPLVEIGKTAAQMLLDIVSGKKVENDTVTFTPEYIRRESVKPL
ncbi:MAG: LacI family DNA-binding transcriptional regulator [Candidatus Omnitrophica bacterium]|nr:LacI family DNA-binding transcriptional regulator [Candidatus Omnitrophota bacterium]MDD5737312.1 LacI family DNA-binding transcriptional regulator [Candidatus Omnitrophota bacterium]